MIKFGNKLVKAGAIFILLASFVCCYCCAITVPEPTSDFYVGDFAKVLSNETQRHINSTSKRFYKEFGAQVVVVTIESLGEESLEEYSVAVAQKWKIGDSKTNKGILILLSEKDRKIRIEVGLGFEGSFNDAKGGRIIRKSGETLKKNLDAGIRMVYDLVVKELGGSGFALGGEADAMDPFSDWRMAGVVLLVVILFSISRRNRSRNAQNHENDIYTWGHIGHWGVFGGGGSSKSDRGGGGHFGGGGASGKF
ncbi:MAG: TPM domain-containing protein [Oscillospiraceae bacterium]|nr:TPM domain-containing protein [Oscillospiraceae bacterium]